MAEYKAPGTSLPTSITILLAKSVWGSYFELWSLPQGLQLPGEILDSRLWLTLVNLSSHQSSSYLSPTSRPIAGKCTYIPGAACMQLVGATVGNRDHVL